jgi:hypothetical protein
MDFTLARLLKFDLWWDLNELIIGPFNKKFEMGGASK